MSERFIKIKKTQNKKIIIFTCKYKLLPPCRDKRWTTMDNVLRYILIGIGIYALATVSIKIISFYWKAGYDERKKNREARKAEKLKWKYCHVTLDNPLLLGMMKTSHFYVIEGIPGSGKSLFQSMLVKFFVDVRNNKLYKNRRMYKYIKPDILDGENLLNDRNKLPVYSELKLTDTLNGYTNEELYPYLFQRKKAVEQCVFVVDEIGEIFGKKLFYELPQDDPIVRTIEETFRYIRQNLEGYIVATEQNGDNIFLNMRRTGPTKIRAIKTVISLSAWGKFKLRLFNTLNLLLPGWFTADISRVKYSTLFTKDRIVNAIKLLLPTYWAMPKEYYLQKNAIKKAIEEKHQRFLIQFQYNGAEYYIVFSNQDRYKYKTRAHKDKYDKQFDENGERKDYVNESESQPKQP